MQQICKVSRPILLVFPLYCHQQPNSGRPIEIYIFGLSEQLVWTTKWSSGQPTNNIRHVKYFAKKSRRPVDSSATLDAQESNLVVGSQENIWSASGTVISEYQQPNLSWYCYYLLNFKAILCFNWSLHCTVGFPQNATFPADKI